MGRHRRRRRPHRHPGRPDGDTAPAGRARQEAGRDHARGPPPATAGRARSRFQEVRRRRAFARPGVGRRPVPPGRTPPTPARRRPSRRTRGTGGSPEPEGPRSAAQDGDESPPRTPTGPRSSRGDRATGALAVSDTASASGGTPTPNENVPADGMSVDRRHDPPRHRVGPLCRPVGRARPGSIRPPASPPEDRRRRRCRRPPRTAITASDGSGSFEEREAHRRRGNVEDGPGRGVGRPQPGVGRRHRRARSTRTVPVPAAGTTAARSPWAAGHLSLPVSQGPAEYPAPDRSVTGRSPPPNYV